MKTFTKTAVRFIVSTVSLVTSCFMDITNENEVSPTVSPPVPHIPTNETRYSSECDAVAVNEDSYVQELLHRHNSDHNQRISVLEALSYEPEPASIPSISTHSCTSIEELDVSRLPLSVDEINDMRLYREAEERAGRKRSRRKMKRKMVGKKVGKKVACLMKACFGGDSGRA